MRTTTTLIATTLVSAGALGASAAAQSMNIDVGNASPVPSSVYGGPAGSAGAWNQYTGGVSAGLLDLAGNSTGVSVSGTGGFLSGFNDPLTLGDDDALLDDFLSIPFIETYTVSGLAAGAYDIYVTTWTFGPLSTGVDVNNLGMQVIGGVWTGGFVPGATHSLHSVTLGSAQDLVIDIFSINGALGAISGIQIVQIPAPGATIGLALGGLALTRRRR